MVTVYTEMYVKSNGKTFKEGSEVLLKHSDGREFVCTIETITKDWIEVTTDDETFDISIDRIISIEES